MLDSVKCLLRVVLMCEASDNTLDALELMLLFAKFHNVMTRMLNQMDERLGTANFLKIGPK
ncbi:hypothetical protein D3C85_1687700 [compost metagenome]